MLSFTALILAFSGCIKDEPTFNPLYDLNVSLKSVDKGAGTGFIKFRQNPDTARVITLDTWVTKLQPNKAYVLQRAVNPITDPTGCTSTAWLTLGEGLVPKSILTNSQGDGSANLWRDITAIPRGAAFHIRFQVVDAVTLTPVLTSDCYDYTVR